MRFALAAWLLVVGAAVAEFGCTDNTKTQVVTGRVATQGAIAVRAVSGDTVVTAARVRTDGSFTLQLPAGRHYRLEVLTTTGVHHVVGISGGVFVDMSFKVCEPSAPFDLGGFANACDPNDPMCVKCEPGDSNCGAPCDPMTDPTCACDPSDPTCVKCDPSDPNCMPPPCDPSDPNCMPPPPPCDPMVDPTCGCDPNDPMCGKCSDPSDPNCVPPPPCDPSDPSCMPPPCDPSDPMCQPCDPTDPDCKMCLPGDPNCSGCDPMVDASCPTPPPPCEDPMDPTTCKDPCMVDPALCGCDPSTEMTCWPSPEPCTSDGTMCTPDGNFMPANIPIDFGCKEAGG